ncbi:YopX family protein [Paenibacillus sp. P32E]|uniref:YopX family protein n=1 Tax=Paenibacillus sp. P32E TaxID=1349434 RepID=UPI00093D3A57|nr:YopX family protein [Paenibacillus sp. P32E]OKP91402.1 hypothetical protein A3848_09870 [Paenibacillus sp. P32E]
MGREIKFRGKDVAGEWHYGLLTVLPKSVRMLQKGSYISNDAGLPFAYQVRPETVGQYTGLQDKNGREIYEGDILHWNIGFDMYSAVECQDGSFWSGETLLADSLEEEVVGNIYENADLIAEV